MGYPNEAERRRLERFPDRIAIEDLRSCLALSDADRELVFAQRGAANRVGLLADQLRDRRGHELDTLLDGGGGERSALADLRRRPARTG